MGGEFKDRKTVPDILEEVVVEHGAEGLRHESSLYGLTEDCECYSGHLCPFLSCPQHDCTLKWRDGDSTAGTVA